MIAKRKRDAISSIRSDLASAFGRKRGVGSKLYSNHLQEGQTGSMEAWIYLSCPLAEESAHNWVWAGWTLRSWKRKSNSLHWKWMQTHSGRYCTKHTQNSGMVEGFSCVGVSPILGSWNHSPGMLCLPLFAQERVGQAHTYIIPLQRDFNVTPSVDDSKSAEKIGELIIIFCNGCQSGKNTHHCLTPELHVL